jgi:hypothetical protein
MEKLQAGFAQEIITPIPSEVFLDGYGFRTSPAEGVHDEIYVKVCAIKQESVRFVLVSMDICGFSEDIADIIIGHITAINGISAQEIAVCATHTHASLACGILADVPVNYMVWHRIGILTGQTVKRAFDTACEGRFAANTGEELNFIGNRRNREGLCDRRVKVMGFYNNADTLIGAIVSASCHPVIKTDMLLSADYPSILTRDAALHYPEVPFLFLQGRCADINPAVPNVTELTEVCEHLGGELRDSVFGTLNKMNINKSGEIFLKSRYKKITVPMMDYPDTATLEETVRMFREKLYTAQSPFERRVFLREMIWHENALKQVSAGRKSNVISVPIQAMVLSKTAAFIFIPFEMFTRTGNTIEKILIDMGYLSPSVMIIGYANGTYGYLAPREELVQGGYEMIEAAHWYGLPQCSDKSEDAVINGTEELLRVGANCVRP